MQQIVLEAANSASRRSSLSLSLQAAYLGMHFSDHADRYTTVGSAWCVLPSA
jgi:hypothetical protein